MDHIGRVNVEYLLDVFTSVEADSDDSRDDRADPAWQSQSGTTIRT